MSKAQDLFRELGIKLYERTNRCILYIHEDDYTRIFVSFDLELKTYHIMEYWFIDKDMETFVPMGDRPENTKHSAYYGHWQIQSEHEVSIELHNAIHQQMIELGWIQ